MHEPLPRRRAAAASAQQHVLHLHRDYETRSRVILKQVGTHRYAADPQHRNSLCAYAVDDEPVQLWMPGDPVPPEFIEARTIQTGSLPLMTIILKQRSSSTSWRRASAGR